MELRNISEMTYWGALSEQKLGRTEAANKLFQLIYEYSIELESSEPKIDYFATSLPAMLLFEDNLGHRQQIQAHFLRGQALLGLDRAKDAEQELLEVLKRDVNHAGAADLLGQIRKSSSIAIEN